MLRKVVRLVRVGSVQVGEGLELTDGDGKV
jgi:hypothetical protein